MKVIINLFKAVFLVMVINFIIINSVIIIDRHILKKEYSNIFGYTFFEIASNSMYPELKKGDLVIIKLNEDYKVGDIVTYWDNSFYTTHRLVEINNDTYITKGDNNNANDMPFNKSKVIGKLVLKLNIVGYLIFLVKQPITIIFIFFIILVVCFRKK